MATLSRVFGGCGSRYDVEGKTALITGAGAGIGRELATALITRGARVVLTDRDLSAVTAVADQFGDRALAIEADVRDREAMSAAVSAAVRWSSRLDVVVANAGVTPVPATVRTTVPEEFGRVIDINLLGVFNTVRPSLDHIIEAGGHVVVVSSAAAFAPGMGGAAYMVSKAAVEQLGRALRVELSSVGASAGVAYFGVVDTEMTTNMFEADPLGREIENMLPWPLRRRISATEAAESIAEGITRRAPRTIAPAIWAPYSWLRGTANVALDRILAHDPRVADLLARIENRAAITGKQP
ncbi:short-chain dehydrogenase/reductase [Nocardia sp. NPDC055321]